jgi:hypothetical protein
MGNIRKYWLELVSWVAVVVYMGYILVYYSWEAFIINVLAGAAGYLAVFYLGPMMPVIGYFIRKWERERHEHDKRGRGADKGDS